jgi:glutaconyl-CoA/methylmalonyl-CoA decarboxylase subunit gamma
MPRPSSTTYDVTIDGRARAVEVQDVAGGDGAATQVRVSIDGKERVVDARPLGGGLWSVLDGNTVRLLQVSGAGPKLTVEVGSPDGEPRTVVAEVAAPRSAVAGAASADVAGTGGPASLQAPIPGRLVKILVKPGDKVSAGQALLVLEAMKMENEVRAPRAGTVKVVHAGEGLAVETGQALVTLE